ncbi:hypothetical protein HK097_000841, partial [Rhizophlyctis rosea]
MILTAQPSPAFVEDLLKRDSLSYDFHIFTSRHHPSHSTSQPAFENSSTGSKRKAAGDDSSNKRPRPYTTAYANLIESVIETHTDSTLRLLEATSTKNYYPRSDHIAPLLTDFVNPKKHQEVGKLQQTLSGLVRHYGSEPFRDLWIHEDGERDFWRLIEKAEKLVVKGSDMEIESREEDNKKDLLLARNQGCAVFDVVVSVLEYDLAMRKDHPEETLLAKLIGHRRREGTPPRIKATLDLFNRLLSQLTTSSSAIADLVQRWMTQLIFLANLQYMDLKSIIRDIFNTIASSLPIPASASPRKSPKKPPTPDSNPQPSIHTFLQSFHIHPSIQTLLFEQAFLKKATHPPTASLKKYVHAPISLEKIAEYHLKARPVHARSVENLVWFGEMLGGVVGNY